MSAAEIEAAAKIFLTFVAVAVVIIGWFKWLRPRLKKVNAESVAIRDAILGRDAILDSITGEERVPALPGIGMRMATVEEALVALADVHVKMLDHEERIRSLETGSLERIAARADSVAAFKAIEAIAKEEDPKLQQHRQDRP